VTALEYRSFDIAQSLGGERASGVGPGVGMPTDQVDVEEVFEKFKAGVAEQIDVDDGQSHYDLASLTRRWASSTTRSASSKSRRAIRSGWS